MMIGITLLIVGVLIIGIWVVVELRRFRHKLLAVFLIGLILFTYFSFTSVIKGRNIDLKTLTGLITATKLYFVWLGSMFGNFKTITTSAVKMDWKGNQTIS